MTAPAAPDYAALADELDAAARREIGAIVACEQLAMWGGPNTAAALAAIRTSAEALAEAARVMRDLAANPNAPLGADASALHDLLQEMTDVHPE